MASDSRSCQLLEAHDIEVQAWLANIPTQLRCGCSLRVELLGRLILTAQGLSSVTALEKLLGFCSSHRLHSPCVTHWRVGGVQTPPPYTHTHVPPIALVLWCSGTLMSPRDGHKEDFILLAQTVCSGAHQQLVFLQCLARALFRCGCVMRTYQQKSLSLSYRMTKSCQELNV